MSKLFTPLKVGNNTLQQRVVMAPLTRYRADEQGVPLDIVAEYYAQRASVPGTLLISEATFISPRASGYPNAPGIYSEAQIKGWRKVTDAVHAKKSFIWLQLWALGRAASPEVLSKLGEKLQSSSAVPMDDKSPKPEELTEEGIQTFIQDYAQAAKNAIEAGFDGVEVHGANGYLIDQFTQDTCNKRTDAWGGSVEKRAKFGTEVAKAVVGAVGAERTGIRLSPLSTFQGMKMKDPVPGFSYLTERLKELNLAYLHLVESRISGNADVESTEQIDFLVDIWGKTSPIFVAGGFTSESAKKVADQYPNADVAVVFGRYFISNPDLPFKLREGIPLTPYNRDTFYKVKSPEGYTDYPFSKEFIAGQA
ncbi:MAG: Chanoclavine-I aldehyde reductase fgaOx3 [Claussenomyces sp. TS43310]|nr:MAG: Chanoclavine-I aldehyde reductase fgaOx3 [Claussenomyces sp. TS43310]